MILLGRNVTNAGAITHQRGPDHPRCAGADFVLRPGYSVSGTGSVTLANGSTASGALIGNVTSTTLGSEIAVVDTTTARTPPPPTASQATNTGLIEAAQGDVTLAGHAVTPGRRDRSAPPASPSAARSTC